MDLKLCFTFLSVKFLEIVFFFNFFIILLKLKRKIKENGEKDRFYQNYFCFSFKFFFSKIFKTNL